jgi:hypothetical protein
MVTFGQGLLWSCANLTSRDHTSWWSCCSKASSEHKCRKGGVAARSAKSRRREQCFYKLADSWGVDGEGVTWQRSSPCILMPFSELHLV